MVRVSDLQASLAFYCDALGLVETSRTESEAGRFTLIFLAAPEDLDMVKSASAPLLELTYNWDPEAYTGGPQLWSSGFFGWMISMPPVPNWQRRASGSTDRHEMAIWLLSVLPDNISIELLQRGRQASITGALGLHGKYRCLVG
jgi:lactoylglutathione lyase